MHEKEIIVKAFEQIEIITSMVENRKAIIAELLKYVSDEKSKEGMGGIEGVEEYVKNAIESLHQRSLLNYFDSVLITACNNNKAVLKMFEEMTLMKLDTLIKSYNFNDKVLQNDFKTFLDKLPK